MTSLLILLSLIALSFNINADQGNFVSSNNKPNVTIGYNRLRISLPIFVADQLGIFSKHGLNVHLEAYDTASPMIQALAENKLDMAGYSALPIIFSAMNRSGKKFYFITKLLEDQKHRISYFLRPKITGKSTIINSIADIKGKRIGILPTTAYRAWLIAMAATYGLKVNKDFTIQQIDPAQQAIALKSGGIDALFTNDPVATAIIASGIGELVSDTVECPKYFGSPFIFGSFVIAKEWADDHPNEMRDIVDSLYEAIDFVNDYPSDANRLMIPYIAEQFKSQVELYPDARYEYLRPGDEAKFLNIISDYVKQKILDKPTTDIGSLLIIR